ncbi:MAG: tetratricopeptide repeat protein [Verrucomicrobiia bacterium]
MALTWPRALLSGALLTAAITITIWLPDRSTPPPTVWVMNTVAPEDLPDDIPVRPDSEEPYHPYKFQLTTEQSIRVFEDRVRDDPLNHLNLTHLASLYVRLARETGNHEAYDRADDALRRALAILPRHTPARVGLALVRCARHRFAEGLRLAEAVYREDPYALDALTIIADAQLELGNYPEAQAAIRELERQSPPPISPTVLARLARLAELQGEPHQAIQLLHRAAAAQRSENDFKEAAAWYTMRLGEVLFSQGRLEDAVVQLDAALANHPRYPAALSLLGRVRAAQGRVAEAKDLCYRAVRINPDVATLTLLADLHAAVGEDFLAKTHSDAIEQTDQEPLAVRDLVLYYCGRDRRLLRALELAEAEARQRNDVYTCDTLAWALYKNNRFQDAEQAMQQALRLGTKDAILLYHAGKIAQALGQLDLARNYLQQSLTVNPHFCLRGAADAKQVLQSLPSLAPKP